MLLTEPFFKGFTSRAICDSSTLRRRALRRELRQPRRGGRTDGEGAGGRGNRCAEGAGPRLHVRTCLLRSRRASLGSDVDGPRHRCSRRTRLRGAHQIRTGGAFHDPAFQRAMASQPSCAGGVMERDESAVAADARVADRRDASRLVGNGDPRGHRQRSPVGTASVSRGGGGTRSRATCSPNVAISCNCWHWGRSVAASAHWSRCRRLRRMYSHAVLLAGSRGVASGERSATASDSRTASRSLSR